MAATSKTDWPTTTVLPLATVRQMIVDGRMTRARTCDGKSRFSRHEKAERARKKWAAREPEVPLVIYPCPFCTGWHLATARFLRSPAS